MAIHIGSGVEEFLLFITLVIQSDVFLLFWGYLSHVDPNTDDLAGLHAN